MLKKNLTRYAFTTTMIIVVMVTWLVADYLNKPEPVVEVTPTVMPVPTVVPEPVVEEKVVEVIEEEVVEETLPITSVTFNRHPDDIPTLEELDVIGFPHGLPGKILLGMSLKESHQDNDAESNVGAKGMFQIRDRTASMLGVVNIKDNYESADAAARYLDHLHNRFFKTPLSEHTEYTLKIVLAAYNAGPNRIRKVGNGYLPPNFRETREYVADIMGFYEGTKYYVQPGDTIKGIASKHDMHPKIFMSVNGLKITKLGEGKYTTNLKYGKFLNVGSKMYLVTNGDTLYSIARRLKIPMTELAKKNSLSDPYIIRVGQLLVI